MAMKKRSKVSAEFSMSSLTDIIFLLLIFFMLTSSMVVPNALNLKLPGKSQPSSLQPKYPPTQVRITRKGNYYLDGNKATKSQIEKVVKQLMKERAKLSLVIEPDPEVANEKVVAILDICNRYKVNTTLTDPGKLKG